MRKIFLSLAIGLALAMPVHGFDPITIIAKEIVKSIVKDFIRNRIMDGLEAQLGSCKMQMARVGIGPHAALVGGVEKGLDMGLNAAMPSGMSSMPGMPDAGALAGAQVGAAGMPDMAAIARMANMPNMPGGMDLAQLQKMQGMAGTGGAAMGSGAGMNADMLVKLAGPLPGGAGNVSPEQMAMVQQMMSRQSPLTPAEAGELTEHFAKLAEAFPESTGGCTPSDVRLIMAHSLSNPMLSGMMRPLLGPMRQMDAGFAESRKTFAAMTPEQQQDYVAGMREHLSGADDEERKMFSQLLRTDLFGMPENVRVALSTPSP